MAESEKLEAKASANADLERGGAAAVEEEEEEEEEERLLEGMAVLDFDMLCATVALQAQGGLLATETRGKVENGGDFGGVQRMWEGGVIDCFEDRRIALETACCPCYRFGKNMGRLGFGSCFIQGAIYFVLVAAALLNCIAFAVTKRHYYLYLAVAFTISTATYMGFFRTQIRKQFNIKGTDSSLDDCVNHLICPCCTLCQESRTLEINNVQDGIWRGRGDTIYIGSNGSRGTKSVFEIHQHSLEEPTKSPDPCTMQRTVAANGATDHSWSEEDSHAEPLVSSTKL
ncbi:hypothetical protein Sjap_003548 [Stephania japonica]|uniref:Uncharacterized protein n=1 Tax=Stephania japonica TaxID=461633 RepID=A0AAP0PTN8_9MAGN